MLEIQKLSKRYANNDWYSVKDLSLTLKEGEIFGFLGSNGSGKSTTIKCMVGILPYGKNDIKKMPKQQIKKEKTAKSEINNETVADVKKDKKLNKEKKYEYPESFCSIKVDGIELNDNPKAYKHKIAYVSDNHAVFERLTGMEYVDHIANLYKVSREDRDKIINKYTKIFHLEKAIHKQINTYSHGMKQKINVIAALVHNPKLWVLDEPLLGLDPVSAYELKLAMREHADNGNIVFFSSHMIDVVYAICDKVGIIVNGVLQDVYDVQKLKDTEANLEQIFLDTLKEAQGE